MRKVVFWSCSGGGEPEVNVFVFFFCPFLPKMFALLKSLIGLMLWVLIVNIVYHLMQLRKKDLKRVKQTNFRGLQNAQTYVSAISCPIASDPRTNKWSQMACSICGPHMESR